MAFGREKASCETEDCSDRAGDLRWNFELKKLSARPDKNDLIAPETPAACIFGVGVNPFIFRTLSVLRRPAR